MPNKPGTSTYNTKKLRHALRNIERDKAEKFAAIVERAFIPNPDKKDIQTIQQWLDGHPELWRLILDISRTIEINLIIQISPFPIAGLAVERNVDEIRQKLGYENGTTLETMLIDDIVRSWLRYQWAEYQLQASMSKENINPTVIGFWEKRLAAAQDSYLKAVQTLAKIRNPGRRHPLYQVNIATQSGQQVNVAGDIVKK